MPELRSTSSQPKLPVGDQLFLRQPKLLQNPSRNLRGGPRRSSETDPRELQATLSEPGSRPTGPSDIRLPKAAGFRPGPPIGTASAATAPKKAGWIDLTCLQRPPRWPPSTDGIDPPFPPRQLQPPRMFHEAVHDFPRLVTEATRSGLTLQLRFPSSATEVTSNVPVDLAPLFTPSTAETASGAPRRTRPPSQTPSPRRRHLFQWTPPHPSQQPRLLFLLQRLADNPTPHMAVLG
jgi:hypothetical protein